MSLEIKLGEDEMGFWKKKKVEDNVNGGIENPSRRMFMKKAGIAAAGAFAATTLGMDIVGNNEAKAGTNYKRPAAIAAEKDQAVRTAWDCFHNSWEYGSQHLSAKEYGAGLLKMANHGPLEISPITQETFDTSFAYRLLVAKVPRRYGNYPGNAPAENRGLRHFDAGVSNLFRKQNISAREEFARGIFASANLGPNDYKKLQNVGIDVKYDTRATMDANALNLANVFINMDLSRKERILNATIWDKFKGVKADSNNNNIDSLAYQMKSVYWNLGFYITTEFAENNDKVANEMRNNNSLTYRKIRNALNVNYNTSNWSLLKI